MTDPWRLTLTSELKSIIQGRNPSKGLCFFLGAGADITSGGILFSALKKRCLLKQGISLPLQPSQLMIDYTFDAFFRSLNEEERCVVLEGILRETRGLHPSDGYRLLVLMAREKVISSVITTNFDNLMEKTESDMGISAFQVYSPGLSIPASYLIKQHQSKAIYLKMHGDVDGRCVTHLTNEELNNRNYQEEYQNLLQHLITNSTVIIAGYSGFDPQIAEIFKQSIGEIHTVYWCNPSLPDPNAPLVKVLNTANKIRYIQAGFDDFVETIASEIFKERMIFRADSIFIWSLIKTKIKKLQDMYYKHTALPTDGICVPRSVALQQYDLFLGQTEKNFFVLSGSQGMGKSVLISQLLWRNELDNLYVIPITVPGTLTPDASAYLVENLGYITANPMIVVYQMAEWLRENRRDVIFVFDSIGNTHSSKEHIANYLSTIIELAYILRHVSNIKFLVSLRDEIWTSVVQSLDQNYLHDILWISNYSYGLISLYLEGFTNKELSIALQCHYHFSAKEVDELPYEIRSLLRIPFFFELALRSQTLLDSLTVGMGGLLPAIEQFLAMYEFSFGQKQFLQNIATKMLDINDANLPLKGIEQNALESLNQILNITSDTISFRHPLFWEYYLVRSFRIKQIIETTGFVDFSWITNTFLTKETDQTILKSFVLYLSDQEIEFDCVCDFFVKLVAQCSQNSFQLLQVNKIIGQVLENWATNRVKDLLQWVKYITPESASFKLIAQRLMYSTAHMSDMNAFLLLDVIRNRCSDPIMIECYVLINDRFSEGLKRVPEGNEYKYFEKYGFVLKTSTAICSLVQLVWLMGKIGLDNVPASKYERLAKCVSKQINSLDMTSISKEDATLFKEGFLRNAYMVFFNANNNLEEKFYCFAVKSKTAPIIRDLLEKGKGISLKKLYEIRSCVDHFDETIEFFVCNLLFIHSMLQNPIRALKELDALYDSFDDTVNALELDFYLSALFMSCYIADPKERSPYLIRFKQTIMDYETLLFSNPAEGRVSSCRRFSDQFDLEFEDGFNALTNYSYTAPSINYIDCNIEKQSVDEFLSEYWKLLETLEKTGNYEKILRLLQAISQMIVNWPEDGFNALKKFVAIKHPLIHRGMIKVLSQNYLRYPTITKRFLHSEHNNFDDNDLLKIQSATTANIEYRTLEQLQWARILFYLRTWITPDIVKDILSIFLTTDTLESALVRIISLVQDPNNDELIY